MEVEGVRLHRGDAASLQPREWLTDAIVNAVVRLWLHRPSMGVVAANTFFMSTLCSAEGTNSGYNYSQVANWMNGWGRPLLEYRRLLVPVNHDNVHWFLLEADMSRRSVRVYDSLGADGCEHSRYTEALCRFLHNKEMEAGQPAGGT